MRQILVRLSPEGDAALDGLPDFTDLSDDWWDDILLIAKRDGKIREAIRKYYKQPKPPSIAQLLGDDA